MFLPGIVENAFSTVSTRARIVIGAITLFIYLAFFVQNALKVYEDEPLIDLPSFHTAAHITFNEHISPFDWKKLDDRKDEVGVKEVYPYLYPPPSLFIFYPLSKVSFPTSRIIALACNHLLIILIVFICALEFFKRFPDKPWAIMLLVLFILNFDPILTTLKLGQVNLLITACLCLVGWLASSPKRSLFANLVIGFCLTVSIMLKIYPGILLILFLFRKEYQIILYTILFSIVFCIGSWLVLPANSWDEWFYNILVMMEIKETPYPVVGFGYPWNISIIAFISRLFETNDWTRSVVELPILVPILSRIASVVLLYFLFKRSVQAHLKSTKPLDFQTEYGLYLLITFLIAPCSWDHHMAMLLPGFLVVGYLLGEGNDKPLILLLVLGAMIIVALKIPFWWKTFYGPALNWFISIKLYAVFVLWLYLYRKSGEQIAV